MVRAKFYIVILPEAAHNSKVQKGHTLKMLIDINILPLMRTPKIWLNLENVLFLSFDVDRVSEDHCTAHTS